MLPVSNSLWSDIWEGGGGIHPPPLEQTLAWLAQGEDKTTAIYSSDSHH